MLVFMLRGSDLIDGLFDTSPLRRAKRQHQLEPAMYLRRDRISRQGYSVL